MISNWDNFFSSEKNVHYKFILGCVLCVVGISILSVLLSPL